MGSARMNLFRQLKQPAAAKAPRPGRARARLSFHLMVGGGLTAISLLGIIANFIGYKRSASAIQAQLRESQKQADVLTAKSEEIARHAREVASLAESAGESVKPAADTPGRATRNDLDGTWTSLLWKVAYATTPRIQVQQMLLGSAGGAGQGKPPSAKQVTIDGRAESTVALRDWLQAMILSIPGYDFIMENTSQTAGGDYPVTFRVTARVL